MVRLKMRKDVLTTEDNITYLSYGINVFEVCNCVACIRDITLNKERLERFIKLCNKENISLEIIDDLVQDFVQEEQFINI